MGDHEKPDDSPTESFRAVTPEPVGPAPSPTPDNSAKIESKLVVATTIIALLHGILEAIQANTAVLDFLPEWARGLAITILPVLVGFLAGYRVPSNRV